MTSSQLSQSDYAVDTSRSKKAASNSTSRRRSPPKAAPHRVRADGASTANGVSPRKTKGSFGPTTLPTKRSKEPQITIKSVFRKQLESHRFRTRHADADESAYQYEQDVMGSQRVYKLKQQVRKFTGTELRAARELSEMQDYLRSQKPSLEKRKANSNMR